MVAYIVGMITGAVCLIFPLVYLMHVDRCIVKIMSSGTVSVEEFLSHTQHTLAYGTAAIGAVVLLLSALLMMATGLARLKGPRRKAKAARPEEDVPLPTFDDEPAL